MTELCYRDKGAQPVLEEILELAKIVIRTLASNPFPKAPDSIHEDPKGHEDQQRVAKMIVAHKNECTLHIQDTHHFASTFTL